MNVLAEDTSFSQAENRWLAQVPELSWERVKSGAFTKDVETYLSDQFVNKRFWTSIKASAEKAVLRKDNNGVYFGKDGYLFEKFQTPTVQLDANSASLTRFLQNNKDANVYGLLAPTSVEIYPEKLPKFAPTDSETAAIDRVEKQVEGISVGSMLQVHYRLLKMNLSISGPIITGQLMVRMLRTVQYWNRWG